MIFIVKYIFIQLQEYQNKFIISIRCLYRYFCNFIKTFSRIVCKGTLTDMIWCYTKFSNKKVSATPNFVRFASFLLFFNDMIIYVSFSKFVSQMCGTVFTGTVLNKGCVKPDLCQNGCNGVLCSMCCGTSLCNQPWNDVILGNIFHTFKLPY
jgi:hypothetical protein